jgi:hypothetical protein
MALACRYQRAMPEDPDRPAAAPADAARDEPEETAQRGPWGGSTYAYRGARIECLPGNHVCGLFMAEHPLSGSSFGAPGTITPLVDLWIEKQQLPGYMRR